MNIAGLREQAEKGNAAAQAALGVCYLEGIEVAVDFERAFTLLSQAADKGVPRALTNLARMYLEGLGTPKSLLNAIARFEAAAAAGEFVAQIELGRIYSQTPEAAHDPDRARVWYSRAAAQEFAVGDCDEIREAKAYIANCR